MITEKDKHDLIEIIKKIDVKKMEINHEDKKIEKWFRFGNFNALQIVCEVIKELPVEKKAEKIMQK